MSTKRGKLSKVETYFIDGNRSSMTDQQIADSLNRGLKIVQKYLMDNPIASESQSLAGQNIQTGKGTTVMTEAASMASDATRTRKLPASHDMCTSPIHNKE